MGYMSEDRKKDRVASKNWWPQWEQELSEYITTWEIFQKAIKRHGKTYGLLQHIEERKNPWEMIKMDCVTVIFPGGKENFNDFLVIVDRYSQCFRFLPS
ncbi:hypothetical protein O181_011418 [Austropuccinia psidii MF-1]|uniref:Uncharacterized protein n=1 Tax=Austropuccinia psidii MF-1 TaxID=1389203 RepID=A0A9Q3BV91_9BASI|nr:hypothetical protein [Austropuccinia psidii MF-1]